MSGFGLLRNTLVKQNQGQQPKDQPLCPELTATVDNFKAFLSEQKKLREELVNLSQQSLVKLKDELSCFVQQVSAVTAGLRRIAAQRDRLKEDVKKEEANVGIIQRNADSGPVMQYENNATIEYFLNKAVEFDARMRSYKQELEVIEENINSQNRNCLSPKDLVGLLQQMDNEFICLAAQLYTVYEQVKILKTRYLRSLRSTNSDSRNPFSEVEAVSAKIRQLDSNLDLAPLSLRQTSSTKIPYGQTLGWNSTNPTSSVLPALTNQGTALNIGAQSNPLCLQTSNLLGQRAASSLNPSVALGIGASPFPQPGAAAQATPGLSGPFQLNPLGATTTANTSVGFGLGFNASAGQKPFSFGLGVTTAASTITTTGIGIGPFSLTAGTKSLFSTSNFPSSSVTTTSAPGSLFGTGLGAISSDSLFGKRVATKPSSLFLPKT